LFELSPRRQGGMRQQTNEVAGQFLEDAPRRHNILQAADWSPDTNSLRWNRKCHVLSREI